MIRVFFVFLSKKSPHARTVGTREIALCSRDGRRSRMSREKKNGKKKDDGGRAGARAVGTRVRAVGEYAAAGGRRAPPRAAADAAERGVSRARVERCAGPQTADRRVRHDATPGPGPVRVPRPRANGPDAGPGPETFPRANRFPARTRFYGRPAGRTSVCLCRGRRRRRRRRVADRPAVRVTRGAAVVERESEREKRKRMEKIKKRKKKKKDNK